MRSKIMVTLQPTAIRKLVSRLISATPLGLLVITTRRPRVVRRSGQPWALRRGPLGAMADFVSQTALELGRRRVSLTASSIVLAALTLNTARAETIILKDGTFIEGKIKLQTSTSVRVETRLGMRTFSRKDIDQIVESVDDSGSAGQKSFADLPPATRAVLNAQAEYDLGDFEKALARIEPFKEYSENKAMRIRIDWLTIEIDERLGRWDVAKKLLKDKQESGTAAEKIRAKAHLDLFEVNPDYDLRFVGKKHARNFILDESLRNKAKEPGALRDHQIMRRALEEYCEQLLVEDKLSVKAFAEKLDVKKTLEAVKKASGSGDIGTQLPYVADMKKAEGTLMKAQAILGDYSSAFELDLARAEFNHLIPVFDQLYAEAFGQTPETFQPAFDRSTGLLTVEGRRQWQERCDRFVEAAKPLVRLADYMVAKVERFPDAFRDLHKFANSLNERLKENVRAVKKARDRTRV